MTKHAAVLSAYKLAHLLVFISLIYSLYQDASNQRWGWFVADVVLGYAISIPRAIYLLITGA